MGVIHELQDYPQFDRLSTKVQGPYAKQCLEVIIPISARGIDSILDRLNGRGLAGYDDPVIE